MKKSKREPPSWSSFVEQHGVVLASAHGPVPSIAAEVAGEPIEGSWWSHPKGKAIFDALSSASASDDVRCFKLVDRKVTFVHRRLWPALVALAKAGVLDADRVMAIAQEHMPSGEHRNITTPFPDWVPADVMALADELDVETAKSQLGTAALSEPRSRAPRAGATTRPRASRASRQTTRLKPSNRARKRR